MKLTYAVVMCLCSIAVTAYVCTALHSRGVRECDERIDAAICKVVCDRIPNDMEYIRQLRSNRVERVRTSLEEFTWLERWSAPVVEARFRRQGLIEVSINRKAVSRFLQNWSHKLVCCTIPSEISSPSLALAQGEWEGRSQCGFADFRNTLRCLCPVALDPPGRQKSNFLPVRSNRIDATSTITLPRLHGSRRNRVTTPRHRRFCATGIW